MSLKIITPSLLSSFFGFFLFFFSSSLRSVKGGVCGDGGRERTCNKCFIINECVDDVFVALTKKFTAIMNTHHTLG